MKKNIIDKIWEKHVVKSFKWGPDLFFIDLHLIHEVTSPQAFSMLEEKNIPVFDKNRTFATIDHSIPTKKNRTDYTDKNAKNQVETLIKNVEKHWITLFNDENRKQGIVHIIWPETGLTQPGKTIVCGDSHTATHWAFGALAFGIWTSQVGHVLASQCLLLDKPKTMKIDFIWKPWKYFSPKDAVLLLIQQLGIQGWTWYAMEFCWEYIEEMSMEWRMTVCNMAIECGAKSWLISPDEKTFKYLEWREYSSPHLTSPEERGITTYSELVEKWSEIISDKNAEYDKIVTINLENKLPVITWWTNPEQSIFVDWTIPKPEDFIGKAKSFACRKSLDYTKLISWKKIETTKIDYVFIGSCTNWRIEDFKIAAEILDGKKVKTWIKAFFVPWSHNVKEECIKLWYVEIFEKAWVDFREPGCSMCLSMNWDSVPAWKRCISTSNRNFVWRQWVWSFTHLASPLMCAISCITGEISNPENYFSN